jgi:hypothetical protein
MANQVIRVEQIVQDNGTTRIYPVDFSDKGIPRCLFDRALGSQSLSYTLR